MITGELKSRIDKLWTEFWTGGVTNPLTVIEQISFLMFSRMLDITETRNEKKAARTGKPIKRIFDKDQQELRWSHFKQEGAEQMLKRVRDEVFPHFKSITEVDTADGTQRRTASSTPAARQASATEAPRQPPSPIADGTSSAARAA